MSKVFHLKTFFLLALASTDSNLCVLVFKNQFCKHCSSKTLYFGFLEQAVRHLWTRIREINLKNQFIPFSIKHGRLCRTIRRPCK